MFQAFQSPVFTLAWVVISGAATLLILRATGTKTATPDAHQPGRGGRMIAVGLNAAAACLMLLCLVDLLDASGPTITELILGYMRYFEFSGMVLSRLELIVWFALILQNAGLVVYWLSPTSVSSVVNRVLFWLPVAIASMLLIVDLLQPYKV
jgi:hypothetical protein